MSGGFEHGDTDPIPSLIQRCAVILHMWVLEFKRCIALEGLVLDHEVGTCCKFEFLVLGHPLASAGCVHLSFICGLSHRFLTAARCLAQYQACTWCT